MNPRTLAAGLGLLVVTSLAQGHAPSAVQQVSGRTMGTTWSVRWTGGVPDPDQVRRGLQAELDRVDGQMSTFKPDSALSRFNRAPAGTWHTLPAEFFTVLQHALRLARDSGGAYDPTVGPLVDLWGFGPDLRPRHPPSPDAIAAARARVGWHRLKLDPARRSAWQPGGVSVDLSAIAKGYAVDQAGRHLDRLGATAWLVEVGGELKARGVKPDGSAWRIGIERPDAAPGAVTQAGELTRTLALHDQAIATSGDYRRAYEDGGRWYSHHIDPRSGQPVPHEVASVSVLADTGLEADPLGTTLSVLGAERGMAYAEEHHLAVLMLVRTPRGFEERMSRAFAAAVHDEATGHRTPAARAAAEAADPDGA